MAFADGAPGPSRMVPRVAPNHLTGSSDVLQSIACFLHHITAGQTTVSNCQVAVGTIALIDTIVPPVTVRRGTLREVGPLGGWLHPGLSRQSLLAHPVEVV